MVKSQKGITEKVVFVLLTRSCRLQKEVPDLEDYEDTKELEWNKSFFCEILLKRTAEQIGMEYK